MQLDRLARAGDVHAVVFLERAGKDANEAQLVHERVDAGFEDLGDQRPGRIGLDRHFFAGFVLRRADDFVGRQRATGQPVEQFRQSDAGFARDAKDRNQTAGGDRLDDQPREFFLGGQRAFEVALRHGVVDFDDRFDQRIVDGRRIDQRAGRWPAG